jgi:hypothetical protein
VHVHAAEQRLDSRVTLLSQRTPLFQGRRIVATILGFCANLRVPRRSAGGQREGQDKYDNGA